MKRLQRYILWDAFRAFLLAFIALSVIMFIGFCMQLLHEGLDVVRLGSLFGPMLAYCVPLVLPAAYLTAVIMTFGRLSADNELIAIRAAGVHLFGVVHPVLAVGVVLAVLSAYLQFQTVPVANGRVKSLKYAALKQILLDSVALSGTRQFNFKTACIQYEDFRDGKMTDLVVLKLRDQRPEYIITAKSATLRADPERTDTVLFDMQDCVVTRVGWQESDDSRGPTMSAGATLWYRVVPDQAAIDDNEKYMPLAGLLERMRQLRERLAGQPREGPSRRDVEVQKAKRRALDIALYQLGKNLEEKRDKHEKYAVTEPRVQEQKIEASRRAITETVEQIRSLQEQDKEYRRQLRDAEESSAPIDWQRQAELSEALGAIIEKIGERRAEREKLEASVQEAQRSIRASKRDAALYSEEIAILEAEKARLLQERAAVAGKLKLVDDRDDLRDIVRRIHKRLAQAISVIVFALIGIPLGIQASRRSVMVAFGLSFAIVLMVFYPLLIFGEVAVEMGLVPVGVGIWAGNVLTGIIGIVLMARAVSR